MPDSFNIAVCFNSDRSITKVIEYLQEKKYNVIPVTSEEHLHFLLREEVIHLLIIELDYSIKDGISLTSDIRNIKGMDQPFIILLSDKQDDYIQITALNSGADDFITTPIKPILLEARIATLKKRLQNKSEPESEVHKHPNFFVDKEQYLIITKAGKISLPRKEFEMINLMYQNSHKIFSRHDIARLIWNSAEVANSRTIDIHIRNIRRSLGNDIIKTTKGVGYTINKELL